MHGFQTSRMNIQQATGIEDIQKCRDVIVCLRPHLADADLEDMLLSMFAEGYRLHYIEENGRAVAFIGFRFLQFLFNGKHIYIDDLCSLPGTRGKGYGTALLNFVDDIARANNLATVTLDSGFQRNDAHRLYLNQGFNLASFHFSKKL